PGVDHHLEALGRDEVIALSFALTCPRRTRRVRDRKIEVNSDRLELRADVVNERGFACAGRSGDDEQGAVRMEVTRHFAPGGECHPDPERSEGEGSGWPGGATMSIFLPPSLPGSSPSLRSGSE